jgi:aminoglycoside phosphotransferase (APT) family kinase protein
VGEGAAVIPVIVPCYSGDPAGAARAVSLVGETEVMVSRSPGRDDGEATRALQRATPSAEALQWVLGVAGARSVDVVDRMPGGASLAMHRVTVTFADGHTARLVLRRYVRPEQVEEEPDVAAREAAVLELVERIPTPTPRLIGVDPIGAQAGTPAVLMTELEGRPDWSAGLRWMRQLVEVLDDVHDIDADTASTVRPFRVYQQESYELPRWVTKPDVWERAIEIFHGPVLDRDRTFIHRDFSPGNVLWHRRAVTGLVDWESASVGLRSIDIAHCRYNLLHERSDATEVFTREWERHTGRTFHRWADMAVIVGLLDSNRRHPPPARERFEIEAILQRAIDEIDGT